MFDLNDALQSWRMSFGESLRRPDLDELEEHLRAELEVLSGGGLSAEEAFLVARRRVGNHGELEREFAKVHAEPLWIGRVQWMLVGYLGINALIAVCGVLSRLTNWSAVSLGVGLPARVGVGVAVQLAAFLALAWLFSRFLRGRLPEGRRFVVLSLLLALSTPLIAAGNGLAMFAQARSVTSEAVGQALLSAGYSELILVVSLPLALFLAVYALERKRRIA